MTGLWNWVGLWVCMEFWADSQSTFLYLNTHFPSIFNSVSIQDTLAASSLHHALNQALGIQRLTRYYICLLGRDRNMTREWQPKKTYVIVEVSSGVMVVKNRSPGDQRSHFLPLTLSGLWRTLTHCEILGHICSLALVVILHIARHLESVASPDLIPQYSPLDDSVLLLLGTIPVLILPSMLPKRAEAPSEVHAPAGRSSGIGELIMWLPERSRPSVGVSVSAGHGQACSGHIACLPSISWGRLLYANIMPGPGSAIVSKKDAIYNLMESTD